MADRARPRRLVLLRHGRTAWNAERRWQGHADVPLDAVGEAQAGEAAAALAELEPALLWSSDLARARQTAEAVAAATGQPVHTDPRLREFDVDDRAGLTLEEYAATHPEERGALLGSGFGGVPGGEPADQVADRTRAALADVVALLDPGRTAVVVVHGGSGKLAALGLLGWPHHLYASLAGLHNCAWAELEEAGPDGGFRLSRWNVSAPDRPDFATRDGVG